MPSDRQPSDLLSDFEILRVKVEALERLVGSTLHNNINGRITAAGAITSGTGFTITKGAAGLYTINFTNPFPVVPITLVQGNGPNSDCIITTTGHTTIAVNVQAYVVSLGVLTNQNFHFLVMAV